jgi:hypothetical protein
MANNAMGWVRNSETAPRGSTGISLDSPYSNTAFKSSEKPGSKSGSFSISGS